MKNLPSIILISAFVILITAVSYGFLAYTSSKNDMPILPETMEVKVYFMNNILDKEITCEKVFPVTRQIAKSTATASTMIAELLKGPTEAEVASGYFTMINPGVKIQSISMGKGVATIDFNQAIQKDVAGSCKVMAIRSQITETLKQVESVSEVIISVDGQTEGILQP